MAEEARAPSSFSDIATRIADVILDAPSAAEAWEQVARYAVARPEKVKCETCKGSGYTVPEDDLICPDCHGVGTTLDTSRMPTVHPLAVRAAENVGGFAAIGRTEAPTVVRGQFVRAYEDFRAEAAKRALDRREIER